MPLPPANAGNDSDEELLDVEAEASRPLTGANSVAPVGYSRNRKMLVLVPLLVLAVMAMMAVVTGYMGVGAGGWNAGSSSGSSERSSFATFGEKTNKLMDRMFGGNATRGGAPEDGDILLPHPEGAFYQRGEQFDRSVSRERGVMVCMHDGVLAMGLSLIRELRCLGNQELVQVYHCGASEISDASKELLFSSDDRLELVDVCSDLAEQGVLSDKMAEKFRSWWIKPLAMYHTDVRHVMLLDVDDIIIKDPASLRELEGYQKAGTTFFYDRVISGCKQFVNGVDEDKKYLKKLFATFDYARFNVSGGAAPSQHVLDSFAYNGKTCHEMDSSLVLIDKARAGQTVMDIMLWFITEERFRFDYSWGDKETFWLAYELAHVPYFFSPWGVSVVSSTPNKDMKDHPDSLCGSILQYLPVASPEEDAEMLYVNGKALLDPYPQGVDYVQKARWNNMFNTFPTHMTPRQPRTEISKAGHPRMYMECLIGLGATPLPKEFAGHLLRRRLHFFGITTGVPGALQHCETYELRRLLEL